MDSLEIQIYRRYKELVYTEVGVDAIPSVNPQSVHFTDLVEKYDAFCFDGYGTLYNRGLFVYPGALDWFSELRKQGKLVRLVTNAASDVEAVLASDADKRGFDFKPEETISSGGLFDSLVLELRSEGYKLREVYYIGRETGKNVLSKSGVTACENPEEAIVAVSSSTATEEMFNHAVEILSRGRSLLLVLNSDAWAPNIDGSRSPVSGALSERLRMATNARTKYLGKPFPAIWDRVRKSLPLEARVLMVGDTLGTDVFGAQVAGFDSALVVGRNVPKESLADDEAALEIRPNYYLMLD